MSPPEQDPSLVGGGGTPSRKHHSDRDRDRDRDRGDPNPNPNPSSNPSSHGHGYGHGHHSSRERVGKYILGTAIGKGSFATVYKGYRDKDRHSSSSSNHNSNSNSNSNSGDGKDRDRGVVAIKAVVKQNLTPKLVENLEGEINILKAIDHPNIVRLEDCIKTDNHVYLVMAFCSGGDLSVYIKKHGKLGEVMTRSLLGQIAEAFKFLRSKHLIHRDIKPQNLLLHPAVESDGYPPGVPQLRIADFGFAKYVDPQGGLVLSVCGSPLYMAVEILRYEKYDAKADLWSIGAVLYEMCTARPPFRAQNHIELLRKIEKNEDRIKFPDEKIPEIEPIPEFGRKREEKEVTKKEDPGPPVADDIKALIRKLLKRFPVQRMSFEEFFACGVWDGCINLNKKEEAKVEEIISVPVAASERKVLSRAEAPVGTSTPTKAVIKRPPTEPKYFVAPSAEAPRPPQSEGGASSGGRQMETAPPSPLIQEASISDVRRPPQDILQQRRGSIPRVSSGLSGTTPEIATPTSQVMNSLSRRISRGSTTSLAGMNIVEETPKKAITGGQYEEPDGGDYVLVEKRTVEVNELADELEIATRRPTANLSRRRSSRTSILGRPITALTTGVISGLPSSISPTSYSPPFALSTTPPFALPSSSRPSPIPYAPSSPSLNARSRPILVPQASARSPGMTYHQAAQEARYSESPNSGQSPSLAKAISVAGLKWFGSPVNALSTFSRRPWARHRPTTSTSAIAEDDPAEEALLESLEDIAKKATALFEFADSKLAQCSAPVRPSPSGGLSSLQGASGTSPGSQAYFSQASPGANRRRSSSASASSADLTTARLEILCCEGLVLYLKALAFLQHGVDKAKKFWEERATSSEVMASTPDFNDTVQWFRSKFNDCFDKAEWAKSKCGEEMPETASYVEKLIYDKAIDLSRAAAVNELVGDDLAMSETGYETALWLLYAVLDPIIYDGQEVGEADRIMIDKVVTSIQTRMTSLRAKISSQGIVTTTNSTTPYQQ